MIKFWIVVLTALASAFAVISGYFAWRAANVCNTGNPVAAMLKPGTRPGDVAGDALTYALIANDKADTAARDAEGARGFNRLAALAALTATVLSAVAGIVSVLAL